MTREDLTEGEHTFRVRSTDAAGNTDASPATHTWTVDLAPDTTIESGPDDPTASPTAQFVFSSNDTNAGYECALDAAGFSSCATPAEYTGLAAGEHTLRVRAKDLAGSVDDSPAVHTWTITVPPETTIDTVTPNMEPDLQTESSEVTFTFSADQPGATLRCSLDTGAFTPCTSPVSYTGLQPGPHDFEVQATGTANNPDPTPATYSWEIGDLTPPVVTLVQTPLAQTEDTTATFTFTIDDPEAVAQCSLDGAPLAVCTSPAQYSGLAAGEHTFEVTALKHHLLADVIPAEHLWTITDTTAPETTIVSGPAAEIGPEEIATFVFSSSEPLSSFECALDPGVLEPQWSACASAPATSAEFDGLESGQHTLLVRALDESLNADATPESYTWFVAGPPLTTIQSGPAEGSESGEEVVFTFAADQSPVTYICSLDGVETVCASPVTYSGLAGGEHTFTVQATNRFGAVEDPAASVTWTVVDTTAPDTNITSGPDLVSTSSQATFIFSSAELEAEFVCSLDGAEPAGCDAPHVISDLPNGEHVFSVAATDAAGNADTTPATFTWTVAVPPEPDTSIVSGPEPTTANADATFQFASNDPAATFECRLDSEAAFSSCDPLHVFEGLALGAHELQVAARSPEGILDATPAVHEWTLVAPDTTITDAPPASTRSTLADFRFASTDPAATYECSLDGAEFSSCASHLLLEDLTVGEHTLRVAASNTAGALDESPAVHTWTVEGPETTIESGPPASTVSASASFTLSSDDPAATFECSLDGAPWGSCESPHQLNGLSVGEHTLQARAKDVAGSVDPTPASRSWTVTPLPDTTLLDRPSDPTNETAATFTFESDQAGASFECAFDEAVDDEVFSACASPMTYENVIFGEHDFAVRARDGAGNVDPTPATYKWQVGADAPAVAIDSAPDARTDATSATFTFSAEGRGLRYECALDTGTFTLCTSPKTYTGLTLAPHSFHVRVVAPDGSSSAQTTTHTWSVVEFDPPETTIVFGPTDPTASRTATFALESDEPLATFQCALDTFDYTACPQPSVFPDLTNGSHTLRVRAIDAFDNVDGSPSVYTWTVDADVTAPVTTILNGPDATTTIVDAGFGFTSEAGATFECSLDAEPFATCTSPVDYTDLPLGEHTFRVRATDLEGNVAAPVVYPWTIELDTTPPETVLHARPPLTTIETDATFSFSSPELGAEFECALDAEPFEGCDSPTLYTELAIGEHTFRVRAVDLAEVPNVDQTPESYTWTVEGPPDTTAPETTIDSGPTLTTANVNAAFTFSSEGGATFECQLDQEPLEECESPQDYTDLLPGEHVFTVRATDLAGNVDQTPATYAWTIVEPPETTIDDAPAATSDAPTARFVFSSNQPGVTFFCGIDGEALTVCTSPMTYSGLEDGEHTFEVAARKGAAIDLTPAEHVWTVAVPPETAITNGPEASTTARSASFSFTGTDVDPTFECSLDGAAFVECESPQPYTNLALGAHTFAVRAIDAEGNVDATPATHAWTVTEPDTTAPQTSFGSGLPAAASSSTNATFNFSSNETGSTFTCSLDNAGFAACDSPKTYTGLSQGAHTFQVRATDAAGNTDDSPASHGWTVDTAAPQTSIGSGGPAATTTSTSASFSFTASETGSTFQCSLDGAAFAACTSPKAHTGLALGAHEFRVRAIDAAGNADDSPATHNWTVQADCGGTAITAAANADAWVDQGSPSQNKGTDSVLKVMSKGPSNNVRALVRFNNPTRPAGCSVASAKLRLYTDAYRSGRTIEALRLAGAWTEGAVSWSNQPSSTGVATGAPSRSSVGWLEIDVTWQVQAMYDSGANNGFLVRDGAENQDAEQQINSREKSSNRPELVVRFGAPDTTPPQTTIDSGPTGSVMSTSATFGFSADQSLSTFECSLDGVGWSACSSPKDYSGLALGSHELRVRATDPAGNTDQTPATRTWQVVGDTTAPETTLGSGAPTNPTPSRTATFSFSGTDNADSPGQLTFECSLDGNDFTACLAPKDYTDLAVTSHSFRVRAVDRAGNRDQSPASYLWTVQPAPGPSCAATHTAAADRDAWVLQSARRRATSAATRCSRSTPRPAATRVRWSASRSRRCRPAARSRAPRCGSTRAPTRKAARSRRSASAPPSPRARSPGPACRARPAPPPPPPRATAPATWSGA